VDAPNRLAQQARDRDVADLFAGPSLGRGRDRVGDGKSTLLAVLAGGLRPDCGHVDVRARRVGLLPQDVVFTQPSRTGQELFAAAAPRRTLSELGLVHAADAARPVGELSRGQQRCLSLAVLLAGQPDLVLLDEPTNHLSLSLVEELEEALRQTSATVVVASHDRWLRQRWPGATVTIAPAAVSRSVCR
jgi:macrolide transport system ATP-binding/permease protein